MTEKTYGLMITEAESNPPGKDSGNEWVELYSDDELSLDNYFLENGDGGLFNLSGSINGYLVITFSGLWLDNSNETIFLKLNGEIIDEIPVFADSKNDDLTFSLCNEEWSMISSTKGEDNNCGDSAEQVANQDGQDEEITDTTTEDSIVDNSNNTSNKSVNSLVNLSEIENNFEENKPQKIILNSRSEANSDSGVEITNSYKTRMGVIYFFIGLCVLLVILIALRKL